MFYISGKIGERASLEAQNLYLVYLIEFLRVDYVLFERCKCLKLGRSVLKVLHEEHAMLQSHHKLSMPSVEVGGLSLNASPHV